jgi:hypothetical protein
VARKVLARLGPVAWSAGPQYEPRARKEWRRGLPGVSGILVSLGAGGGGEGGDFTSWSCPRKFIGRNTVHRGLDPGVRSAAGRSPAAKAEDVQAVGLWLPP